MTAFDDDARIFIGLSRVSGIGFHTLQEMGGVTGTAHKILRGDLDPYIQGIFPDATGRPIEDVLLDLAAPVVEELERAEVQLLRAEDPRFPKRLRDLPEPDRPLWLFYRGRLELLELECAAVVGTRSPTRVGEFLTAYAVAAIAELGRPIISGLAIGIDSLAHEWCLMNGVPTISVLATGLLRTYPARNRTLADAIVNEGGLLLTEYLPHDGPTGDQFVARNRLQAALAGCVVAPEWKKSSGTAHTIRFAHRMDRQTINLRMESLIEQPEKGDAKLTFTIPRDSDKFLAAVGDALGIEKYFKRGRQADIFGGS